MENVFNFFTEHWVDVTSIFGSTVAICSALVKILKATMVLRPYLKVSKVSLEVRLPLLFLQMALYCIIRNFFPDIF